MQEHALLIGAVAFSRIDGTDCARLAAYLSATSSFDLEAAYLAPAAVAVPVTAVAALVPSSSVASNPALVVDSVPVVDAVPFAVSAVRVGGTAPAAAAPRVRAPAPAAPAAAAAPADSPTALAVDAPATASVSPAAAKAAAQPLAHARALRMQSIPMDPNMARPGWSPLDAPARMVSKSAPGDQLLEEVYDRELATARTDAFSDQQRLLLGTRWLGVVESELRRRLCYKEKPAVASISLMRARMQAKVDGEADASSASAKALTAQIGELDQRLDEMAIDAASLHQQLLGIPRLRDELSALSPQVRHRPGRGEERAEKAAHDADAPDADADAAVAELEVDISAAAVAKKAEAVAFEAAQMAEAAEAEAAAHPGDDLKAILAQRTRVRADKAAHEAVISNRLFDELEAEMDVGIRVNPLLAKRLHSGSTNSGAPVDGAGGTTIALADDADADAAAAAAADASAAPAVEDRSVSAHVTPTSPEEVYIAHARKRIAELADILSRKQYAKATIASVDGREPCLGKGLAIDQWQVNA